MSFVAGENSAHLCAKPGFRESVCNVEVLEGEANGVECICSGDLCNGGNQVVLQGKKVLLLLTIAVRLQIYTYRLA